MSFLDDIEFQSRIDSIEDPYIKNICYFLLFQLSYLNEKNHSLRQMIKDFVAAERDYALNYQAYISDGLPLRMSPEWKSAWSKLMFESEKPD